MKPRRYYELLGRLFEGELTDPEAEELSDGLRASPILLQDLSQHLVLWEVWSQRQAPERSATSFLDAWKTRLRAEDEATDAFSRTLRERLRPSKAIPTWIEAFSGVICKHSQFRWAACSLIFVSCLLLWLASPRPAHAVTTIQGQAVCTACTLHESTEHQPAIRLLDGHTERIYYLDRNSATDGLQDYFCSGPHPVSAKGRAKTENGRLRFDATTVTIPEVDKSKQRPTNDVRTIFPI